METLYSTEYDNDLQNQLPHLKNYPELLPFIGNKWNESELRILLIAESHYIDYIDKDKGAISEAHAKDWYNYKSSDFIWPTYLNSINTRQNITNAELDKYKSPYLHYYNMKKAITSNIPEFKNVELVYPYFAYYNYFQRPAYKDGASIINNAKDNEIAYNTFKTIIEIIKPNKTIFTSNKSFSSFLNSRNKSNEQDLFSTKIYSVPHPGSAWWNRKSANYGKVIGTNNNRTGRERFVDIITSKI